MSQSPWLWLIAGPNGAGKSTYAPNLSSVVEEIVRPDELAQSLSPAAPEKVAVKAGRLALRKIERLLGERRSFAIETTLSGRFHLEMVSRAKSEGWEIGIIFIGLRSPRQAVQRVRLRHLMGGHNVPPTDVRRRYRRSLDHLTELYPIVSRLLVLDNSSERQPMRPLFEAHKGRIVFRRRRLPKWLSETLNFGS